MDEGLVNFMKPLSEIAFRKAVDVAIKSIERLLSRNTRLEESVRNAISEQISLHLEDLKTWSSSIQCLGLPRPQEIETTIPLRLSDVPRRIRSENQGHQLEEVDLLSDSFHYLVLGDPGSGKTTMVKRLTRTLLTTEPACSEDVYQFPLVVLFRTCRQPTFERLLASVIGVRYIEKDDPSSDSPPFTTPFVGDTPLEVFLAELLNELNPVILLDGLDELPFERIGPFAKQIVKLSRRLTDAKIILTCRTGGPGITLDGFHVNELCPLQQDQAFRLAQGLLNDPIPFFEALKVVPYNDLADRPLLLWQLLFLFLYRGSLPEQPSDVYRIILWLLLRQWDEDRGILRTSKYADFHPERKVDFLSEIAYLLTYKVKTKRFSTTDLIQCYEEAHFVFGLPKNEGEAVAREIQSHTGIIVASGFTDYEFSHLSLQEYLCANRLVRTGQADLLPTYLLEYPAPIAVAIALSADPANWFSRIFLDRHLFSLIRPHNLGTFLSRLVIERPRFKPEAHLGCAILKIFFQFWFESDDNVREILRRTIELTGVSEAVLKVLRSVCTVEYLSDLEGPEMIWVNFTTNPIAPKSFEGPFSGALPSSVFLPILKDEDALG